MCLCGWSFVLFLAVNRVCFVTCGSVICFFVNGVCVWFISYIYFCLISLWMIGMCEIQLSPISVNFSNFPQLRMTSLCARVIVCIFSTALWANHLLCSQWLTRIMYCTLSTMPLCISSKHPAVTLLSIQILAMFSVISTFNYSPTMNVDAKLKMTVIHYALTYLLGCLAFGSLVIMWGCSVVPVMYPLLKFFPTGCI